MSITEQHLSLLLRRKLALVRLGTDEWRAIKQGRARGARFALNYLHKVALGAKTRGLVLIAIEEDRDRRADEPSHDLHIGVVTSILSVSFFDSRVVFDFVSALAVDSLQTLLSKIAVPGLSIESTRIASDQRALTTVPPELADPAIRYLAADPINREAFLRIISYLDQPTHYHDARALQSDAISLALKAFGGRNVADAVLVSDDSGLARLRVQEDAVIEHDARSMLGWTLEASDITGRAYFSHAEGDRLEVVTANKRPLEEIFGVDLIYFNERRSSLVMVQYKMMEPVADYRSHLNPSARHRGGTPESEEWLALTGGRYDTREWSVRVDYQFMDEIDRMMRFTEDLSPDGPYRLNPGPFFVKFVQRDAKTSTAGILLSLDHLRHVLRSEDVYGPRGGVRIRYHALDGHFLRAESFVELIRSGYVGSRGATTEHLTTLIEAALWSGRAVVAAVHRLGDRRRGSRPVRGREYEWFDDDLP
jgi:hypothetical protein